MRFVDEFRDPAACLSIVEEIREVAPELGPDPVKLMEVCGGHTHTIYRCGIPDLLPPQIELVHGPGCPVCVVPMGRIDDARALAERSDVTLCTFGDVVRVPGKQGSLLEAKARGADVRIVYSPMDALELARRDPDRTVVFVGIGFETTAPSTAATVLRARSDGIENFLVFSNHVAITPALRAILESPGQDLDGFIGPGHVSSIIGTRPYRFVVDNWSKAFVVAGFEPLDLLQAILMLVHQLREGRRDLENQYRRVVGVAGNRQALELMDTVFELRPTFEWRGLGFITRSAYGLRDEFAAWDAEARLDVPDVRIADPKACQCGEILKGARKPWECKVFGTACTPENPIGTCMVSAEGACAAYYSYGRAARSTPTETGSAR